MDYKEKKDVFSQLWVWLICGIASFVIAVAVYHSTNVLAVSVIAGLTLLLLVILLACYPRLYFTGPSFLAIKKRITKHIKECNELNQHIKNLRDAFIRVKKTDYGEASFENISRYKYNKRMLRTAKYAPNIYDCSRVVCDNARKQPFKYICKYFHIHADEQTIDEFEEIINNFSAAEDGKYCLMQKKNNILKKINNKITRLICVL